MISNSKALVGRKCPKCGSPELVRSQRAALEDRLLSIVNIYPYRCRQHTCKHRFQAFGRK